MKTIHVNWFADQKGEIKQILYKSSLRHWITTETLSLSYIESNFHMMVLDSVSTHPDSTAWRPRQSTDMAVAWKDIRKACFTLNEDTGNIKIQNSKTSSEFKYYRSLCAITNMTALFQ